MEGRKQTGRRADYLCSGLVYCGNCGSKMHAYSSTNKGHKYVYYRCSESCGASGIRLDSVDAVAKQYIQDLLSDDTQKKIARVLRSYAGHEKACVESFNAAIEKKISEKEKAYSNILANMSATILPPEVISALSDNMMQLKAEIEELKKAEPPVDYSVDTIQNWLTTIRESPDSKAIRLLIARIVINQGEMKTDVNIESTLASVLEKVRWDSSIHTIKRFLPPNGGGCKVGADYVNHICTLLFLPNTSNWTLFLRICQGIILLG